MTTHKPVTSQTDKDAWIGYLNNVLQDVNGKPEGRKDTDVTNDERGDVAVIKDLAGAFLATLQGSPVSVD